MSEDDNLIVVKDVYSAYRDRDIPALLNCLAEDVKWFSMGPPEIIRSAGTRYGRAQIEQYLGSLEGMGEAERFEPREFIAEGDKVVTIGDSQRHIKSTGSIITSPWIHVFTLSGGKITEVRSFYDTAAAIAALESTQARPASTMRSEPVRPGIF